MGFSCGGRISWFTMVKASFKESAYHNRPPDRGAVGLNMSPTVQMTATWLLLMDEDDLPWWLMVFVKSESLASDKLPQPIISSQSFSPAPPRRFFHANSNSNSDHRRQVPNWMTASMILGYFC